MLDYAALRSPDDRRIIWRQADALALPFDDKAFDAVVCQFADVVTQVLAKLFPEDALLFMACIPRGYHDVARIEEEFGAAGFASVSVETRADTSKARSAHEVAIAYCQGTPLRNEIEARDASRIEEATRTAAEELAQRFGAGPITGQIRAHVFTAARR